MGTTVKLDTKTALLQAGKEIMLEKGYSNTGIQEVLTAVGVPKGSFYHYFDSKEDFALKIIEYADQMYGVKLASILKNSDITPLNRLKNYCKEGKKNLAEQECGGGCLIGNLSQEMSDQSETLRKALDTVMSRWKEHFTQCILEGQKAGEINNAWSAAKMAEFFLSGWEGTLMRAKSIKSVEPVNIFIDLMFNHILKTK